MTLSNVVMIAAVEAETAAFMTPDQTDRARERVAFTREDLRRDTYKPCDRCRQVRSLLDLVCVRVPERRPTATKVLPDPGVWWCEKCASENIWPPSPTGSDD